MEADAARHGQAGDGEDLGDRLGRAVIGHARPLRGLVPVVAGRGDQRALAHGDELGEGRDGHSHWRHCCGADTIQHAEGGQPFERKGALDLGKCHLLLVGAAVVLERADVLGGSRLLLGRVLVVLGHVVGRGRVLAHRVAEVEIGANRLRGRPCGERSRGHPPPPRIES
eukprot:scaffold11501_cov72-Phaeocystis_antarctica.AAC.1